jgi:hypothetical protein
MIRDGLTLEHAAYARQCSAETMRKECEESAATKRPLEFKFPKGWIMGKTRLLDSVEEKESAHARRVAETRLKEYEQELRANAIRREP